MIAIGVEVQPKHARAMWSGFRRPRCKPQIDPNTIGGLMNGKWYS